MKKKFTFYGEENATCSPIDQRFSKIKNPKELFEILLSLWSKDSCAPRMRESWSKDNPTLGQCSITAFLVQDIFGGEVLGVPLGDGNFHCFNKVNGIAFDLTSSQFEEGKLDYSKAVPQTRESHFQKEEKKARYLTLKRALLEKLVKS